MGPVPETQISAPILTGKSFIISCGIMWLTFLGCIALYYLVCQVWKWIKSPSVTKSVLFAPAAEAAIKWIDMSQKPMTKLKQELLQNVATMYKPRINALILYIGRLNTLAASFAVAIKNYEQANTLYCSNRQSDLLSRLDEMAVEAGVLNTKFPAVQTLQRWVMEKMLDRVIWIGPGDIQDMDDLILYIDTAEQYVRMVLAEVAMYEKDVDQRLLSCGDHIRDCTRALFISMLRPKTIGRWNKFPAVDTVQSLFLGMMMPWIRGIDRESGIKDKPWPDVAALSPAASIFTLVEEKTELMG